MGLWQLKPLGHVWVSTGKPIAYRLETDPCTCPQQPCWSHPSDLYCAILQGGSPYGAGLLAGGDGSRQPSEYELGYAKYQARTVGKSLLYLPACLCRKAMGLMFGLRRR